MSATGSSGGVPPKPSDALPCRAPLKRHLWECAGRGPRCLRCDVRREDFDALKIARNRHLAYGPPKPSREELETSRDELAAILQKVWDYKHGRPPFNFSGLRDMERSIAALEAWEAIELEIHEALFKAGRNPRR